MSVDIYASADLTKKVRFKTGEKEQEDDGKADFCRNTDNVTIYDNDCTAELPELPDVTTKAQQQINEPPIRGTLSWPTTVCLLLLCLLLLAAFTAVAVLVVFGMFSGKERDELRTRYDEMKSRNVNLTLKTSQLEKDVDLLRVDKNNLTEEKDELQEQIKNLSCPADWKKVGGGCFLIWPSKSITDRKSFCESQGAELLTESSLKKQTDQSLRMKFVWTKKLNNWQRTQLRNWLEGTLFGQVIQPIGPPDQGSPDDTCLQKFENMYFHPNPDVSIVSADEVREAKKRPSCRSHSRQSGESGGGTSAARADRQSADVYPTPDHNKKVRFKKSEKQEEDGRKADSCRNTDNVTINDNGCTAELPGLPDVTTTAQQQINEPPIRGTLSWPTTVYLLLLCLLLLAAFTAVAVLVVFVIHGESRRADYDEIKRINANLTTERDELRTRNDEMKSRHVNLTLKTSQLQNDVDLLRVDKNNLNEEKDKLQEQIKNLSCPADWKKVGSGCFLIWPYKSITDRKSFCESHGAELFFNSTLKKQTDRRSRMKFVWNDKLNKEQRTRFRKWLKGTVVDKLIQPIGPPDQGSPDEICLQKFQNLYFHPNPDVSIGEDYRCTDEYVVCGKIR